MLTLKQVKAHLAQTKDILVDLNISMGNMVRLQENIYVHEDTIKRHGFWQHHFFQLKFISVIQLCKLFSTSDQQKIRFEKLFTRFENERYDQDLNDVLKSNQQWKGDGYQTREDILLATKSFREKITESAPIINKITLARNKVYAHHDIVPNKDSLKLPPKELYHLINLASAIHNEIDLKLFNNKFHFSHTNEWNIDSILKFLSDNKQSRMDIIQKKTTEYRESNT